MTKRSVYIGSDPRFVSGFQVTRATVERFAGGAQVEALALPELRSAGLYSRQTTVEDGKLFDVISGAPMSTEFAISRFLTPTLAGSGWSLFMDGDMLVRASLADLFTKVETEFADKALVCVQHVHVPSNTVKMDGQAQLLYKRKNWSSFMLFNCDHPANRALTVAMVNDLPGRDLHRFAWLPNDNLIGGLGVEWNYLVGFSQLPDGWQVKNVHFTEGTPDLPGHENDEFADEWRAELAALRAEP